MFFYIVIYFLLIPNFIGILVKQIFFQTSGMKTSKIHF